MCVCVDVREGKKQVYTQICELGVTQVSMTHCQLLYFCTSSRKTLNLYENA